WTKPVPGWIKETEWTSYLSFEENPQLLNPPSGFLQNCNNPPRVATKNSGLKPLDPAPYYLQVTPSANAGEEALNTRGEMLFQVFAQGKKFTADDIKTLVFDTYVLPADMIVPLLSRTYARQPSTDPRVNPPLEYLKAWNHRSAVDSIAYTYISFWGAAYQDLFSEKVFSRFIGYSRRAIRLDSSEEQAVARRALEEALVRMQKKFGKTEIPWGEVNIVERGVTFPLDGTGLYDVLHPDDGPMLDDGKIHSNDGWGHAMVVVEDNPKTIWSLLPYGESENPASPHYSDQTKLHSQRQLKRFWFTPEEILAHTESTRGDRNRIPALLQSHSRAARRPAKAPNSVAIQ